MIKKIVMYLSFSILACSIFSESAPAMSSRPTRAITYPVRVAVIMNASTIKLKIKGNYSIYALPLAERLKEGKGLRNVTIKPTYSGMMLGNEELKVYGVKIKTDNAADIYINGRRFRGEMDIIRTEDLKLTAINHLDVEDYISGVLYHEVSHRWPMDVLKAQAIASRTFAVYKSIEAASADYDLRNDIYSQVYGGKTSEKSSTNRAVEETDGKVLVYRDKILPAYFHATCGGHTEDAALLWKTKLAPLKGRACRYCEESPHYTWKANMLLKDIETELKENGYKIRGIRNIKTSSRDRSGRVKTIHVIDSLGTEKIPANKFRLAIGPNTIRSTNFKVKVADGLAIFNGRGWGHGVGLCQWGAYYMAKQGVRTENILKFYYPGAKIMDLKDIVK